MKTRGRVVYDDTTKNKKTSTLENDRVGEKKPEQRKPNIRGEESCIRKNHTVKKDQEEKKKLNKTTIPRQGTLGFVRMDF